MTADASDTIGGFAGLSWKRANELREAADTLREAGYESVVDVREASQEELSVVEGISDPLAAQMKANIGDSEGDSAGESSTDGATESDNDTTDDGDTEESPSTVTADPSKWIERIAGVGGMKADALREAGYGSITDVHEASQEDLAAIEGIGNALAAQIKADVEENVAQGRDATSEDSGQQPAATDDEAEEDAKSGPDDIEDDDKKETDLKDDIGPIDIEGGISNQLRAARTRLSEGGNVADTYEEILKDLGAARQTGDGELSAEARERIAESESRARRGYVQARLVALQERMEEAERAYHDAEYAAAQREFTGITHQLEGLESMLQEDTELKPVVDFSEELLEITELDKKEEPPLGEVMSAFRRRADRFRSGASNLRRS